MRIREIKFPSPLDLLRAPYVVALFVAACASQPGDFKADAMSGAGQTAGDGSVPPGPVATDPASAALIELLPADTRGAAKIDVASLRSAGDGPIGRLLLGDNVDPALAAPFEAMGQLALGVDLVGQAQRVVVAETGVPGRTGLLLLAQLDADGAAEVVDVSRLGAPSPHGDQDVYMDAASGLSLSLLPEGVLVIGQDSSVRSVVDVSAGGGGSARSVGSLGGYVTALSQPSDLAFVYGLPGLYGDTASPGPGEASLRASKLVSGAFDFSGDAFHGELAFHIANATEFVEAFNDAVEETTQPLVVGEPLAEGLPSSVRATFEGSPIDKSAPQILASRELLKKLTHGMDALDYAEGVQHGGNMPWMNFDVGGSPNSIFVNYEFADQAQIDAFEANELPAGFELAPIRILDTDEPSYFLVLNIYNSSGGLVSGARAEWSVFVKDPEDGHPRFLVVQAAAADIAADSVNLLTLPEPVRHELIDDHIVSYVGVEGDEGVEPEVVTDYWKSSIPWPQSPAVRVGFAREFVAGNDFIYWGNGVSDRGLYNASVHNREGILIPDAQIEISDDSVWKTYLKPRPTHSYVYQYPLDIVISPWWNLDADYLDVTADELQELINFKNGFYPSTVKLAASEALRGEGHSLAAFTIPNTTPSAYFNFPITDPDGLQASLGLPEGQSLAAVQVLEGDAEPEHLLTLRVYQPQSSDAAVRAEWSVYVQNGSGETHTLVLDVLSSMTAADPVHLLKRPSSVEHTLAEGVLKTTLRARNVSFDASLELPPEALGLPTLNWVEAGDRVCRLNGICDKMFYGGGTLEEPVMVVASPETRVSAIVTPWDAFIAPAPRRILVRTGFQQYASNPWFNAKN